jgi:hypothetical protein
MSQAETREKTRFAMRPSLRFVRSLDQVFLLVLGAILSYLGRRILDKTLDFIMKKTWAIARPRIRGFVSRLIWYFPVGIVVLTLQALVGLGYLSRPTSTTLPILDDFMFYAVPWTGLLLTTLGLSIGGPRRSFNGIRIVKA